MLYINFHLRQIWLAVRKSNALSIHFVCTNYKLREITSRPTIAMQRISSIIRKSKKGTQRRVVWCSHASLMKLVRSLGTSSAPAPSPSRSRNKIYIDLFMTVGMTLSPLNYKLEFQNNNCSHCLCERDINTFSKWRWTENSCNCAICEDTLFYFRLLNIKKTNSSLSFTNFIEIDVTIQSCSTVVVLVVV